MSEAELVFFWLALIGYGIVGVLSLVNSLFKKDEKFLVLVERTGLLSFIFHLIALVVRTVLSGHFPVKGGYENAIVGAGVVLALYFILTRSFPSIRLVGSGVYFVALIVMGTSLTNVPALTPLTPAYKSIWLWIHVTFAWLAYGSYTIATALAVLFLIKEKNPGRKDTFIKIPSLKRIDEIWYRYVAFGFVTNAVMIASGAVWAHYLWGSYWSWDPVETWSLITWLVFGLFLHLKITLGWKGRRLAWLTIVGLLTVNIAFWGVQIIPSTFHLFRNL